MEARLAWERLAGPLEELEKCLGDRDPSSVALPQSGEKFNCSRDEDCHKHFGTILSNGIITGVCLQDYRRCEIQGWCPTENDDVEIEPMLDIDNFTIFIKNSIRFPLFDVTRGNFPSSMTSQEIKSCTFHPVKNPFCPIFRVGDVLNYTKQTTKDLAHKGGEIGINIQWKCNLDLNIEECVPQYSFTRLDKPFEKNAVSKGYNFRFAKYFKTENGTEFRTLHKVFAIRFDVMVTGSAGKFNTIPTLINLVAAFTSVGLGTVLCDIILLNFLKGAEQYKAKKFEEVSDAQIEASLAQSPVSQLSLKTGQPDREAFPRDTDSRPESSLLLLPSVRVKEDDSVSDKRISSPANENQLMQLM
ncbi:hypothetical protein L3Q82_005735 [Scortum barcoo]|uniref:Uncharacterized protein n=1 Tax=Scortum barcoo TaxID=214431 RepID=A0ACB8V7H7_9TELE|nr:hypothetical protein L3Q82_005735 [Scortum barcoo]